MAPGVAGRMRELAVARSSARRESRSGRGEGGGEGREGEGLCEVMLGGWCPWAAVRGGEGERGGSRCSCCPWDALVAAVCPWETELSRPWQGCAFISSPAGSRV